MADAAAPPPFEGPEKRLEVAFRASPHSDTARSLRSLPRRDIDALLAAAACSILSIAETPGATAYLLSESSLFVFARRLVIKTCGTTTLLAALPVLLAAAEARCGLVPAAVQYSRAAFLFPEAQPFPHDAWANEARFLDKALGPAAAGVALEVGPGKRVSESWQRGSDGEGEGQDQGCVGGEEDCGDGEEPKAAWHMYLADLSGEEEEVEPRQTLEVCMYGLDGKVMRQYFGNGTPDQEGGGGGVGGGTGGTGSGGGGGEEQQETTTARTGITRLLRTDTQVDAFDFYPCGYSMNGLVPQEGGEEGVREGGRDNESSGSAENSVDSSGNAAATPAYYTIHISPEPEASYVSFETSLATPNLVSIVAAAVKLFKPARFSATFVGTQDSVSMLQRPAAPLDWHKLRKLLADAFHMQGTPACLRVSANFVAVVAAFIEGPAPCAASLQRNNERRRYANTVIYANNSRSVRLDACMSSTVQKVAVAFGARVISCRAAGSPLAPVAKATSGAVMLNLSDTDASEVSSSASSSALSDSSAAEEAAAADGSEEYAVTAPELAHASADKLPNKALAEVAQEFATPLDQPVFVVDLGVVERRIAAARRSLGPAVDLRYAVHCNGDSAILSLMDGLGVKFEAASPAEVALLRGCHVPRASIAYVSPLMTQHVLDTVVDDVHSVAVYGVSTSATHAWLLKKLANHKVAVEVRVAPHAADDALACIAAANEAGVRVESLGLDVAPDTGCLPAAILRKELVDSLETMSVVLGSAKNLVSNVSISLGEQYPGGRDASTSLFEGFVAELLGDLPRVTVDAGRYIVGPAVALVTSVIGRRLRAPSSGAQAAYNYYMDDGVYGAFSKVLMEGTDGALEAPLVFRRRQGGVVESVPALEEASFEATLFGPTCDALDRIWSGLLVIMEVGDMVVFPCMGGYAASAVSHFNGFAGGFDTRYIVSKPIELL